MGNPTRTSQAVQIVNERGRWYFRERRTRDQFPTIDICLTVFTTNLAEANLLRQVFGGNHHPHRAGYVWTISKKTSFLSMDAMGVKVPYDEYYKKFFEVRKIDPPLG